jgi:hypothetical protein
MQSANADIQLKRHKEQSARPLGALGELIPIAIQHQKLLLNNKEKAISKIVSCKTLNTNTLKFAF